MKAMRVFVGTCSKGPISSTNRAYASYSSRRWAGLPSKKPSTM
jgi:hypothetical protein